jgi:hypothetical protein
MDDHTLSVDDEAPARRGSVRLQFYLSGHVARKIEHVGAVFGHPTGKAAAMLLDGASGCERRAGDVLVERLRVRSERAESPAPRVSAMPGLARDDVVLLQVPLATAVADRIGRIARQQELTRAKVCALLLDRAVDDPLWIVDIFRSRIVAALTAPAVAADSTVPPTRRPR